MANFVTGSRRTSASCERVWSALADVDRWPETFTPHLSAAHLEGNLAPGATGWVRTRFPPMRSPFTVTAVDTGRSWTWRGRILWLQMNFQHRVDPAPEGCVVTFDVDLDGVAAPLVRALGRLTYRPQMNRALDRLVEHAEAA